MASKSSASPCFERNKSCVSNFRFEIDSSKSENLQVGRSIDSPKFTAGGYNWILKFYPQGKRESQTHSSVVLVLTSDAKDITARFSLKLLSKTGNVVSICHDAIHTFSKCNDGWRYKPWRVDKSILKSKIKDLYCEKDSVVMSCDIRVFSEPKIVKNYPGGLHEHLEKLWEKGEKSDVTFDVEGESISAHRLILAARSPVFEAKLFGPTAEAKMDCIKINDMKAEVFKALLHFVYADQLPINGSGANETLPVELLQGLFVAADQYDFEKLTLLCEEQLAEKLSVDTVVSTLHLAHQHSCLGLKRKCFDFASNPENLSLVALNEDFLHIMSSSPSLFAELNDEIKSSPRFAQKLRTV